MKAVWMLAALAAFCVAVPAQEAGTTSPGTTGGMRKAAQVISPEIGKDNRVTFRLYAPQALMVMVEGNWPGGRDLAMTKDETGLWTGTTPAPLKPELWAYTFSIDGVRALDINNYNVVRDGVGFMNTLLVVGDESKVLQPQKVPHGTVTTAWIPSALVGAPRRAHIYTPPGYEQGKDRYPVFVLVHGSGGDEDAWRDMGIANVILDNLIAEGKAKPMILVMANAYWDDQAALDLAGPRQWAPRGVGGAATAPAGASAIKGLTAPAGKNPNEQDFVGDILPWVEKNFRTLPGRENRAIAGLSMGSQITVSVAVKRTDVFASIGVLSAGMFRPTADSPGGTTVLDKINPDFLKNVAATNQKMKLLLFACGTEDPRLPSLKELWSQLEAKKLNFVVKTYPGEHEWKVWRHTLVDMAQMLFK